VPPKVVADRASARLVSAPSVDSATVQVQIGTLVSSS